MRNKSEKGGFLLKNHLTSNIKNDIRRTKSDFAISIQGINMEALFLSQFFLKQPKVVFMDLCRTCDCLNVRPCTFEKGTQVMEVMHVSHRVAVQCLHSHFQLLMSRKQNNHNS